MTKEMINGIKEQISNEFDNLSFKDYEDLCYGDGTLAILDKVLSNYDHIDFTDDEANELAEYCMQYSNAFRRKIELYNISQDLADTISRAFVNDQRGIARFKFWLDIYTAYAQPDDDEHVNNYHQLLLELMSQRGLQENELNEYANEYDLWLRQQMDSIMDGFAEACADSVYNIDDHDDWLAWLGGFDDCTFQDMRCINMHWNDAAKAKYGRGTHFKCFNINCETGELINETDYYGTYEDVLKQFIDKTVIIDKMNKDDDINDVDEQYDEIICEHNYDGNPVRYYNQTIDSAKAKYCEENNYNVNDVICFIKD